MKYGIREICDVVFRAKAKTTLGSRTFYKNEPVLYFDSLKTSSLEGAATTVYAQGGRGNARLVAWEGERTLTFTMEDALISSEGFAILSGAGLVAATEEKPLYVHTTSQVEVKDVNTIVLENIACWNRKDRTTAEENSGVVVDDYFHSSADIFVMKLVDGEMAYEPCVPNKIVYSKNAEGKPITIVTCLAGDTDHQLEPGSIVLVDYYVKRKTGAQVIEITADKFGGNYYVEASTLFRRESDGVDMPAEFVIPNAKVQSNFTFSMASSGDPSTFTFTMDAFPDYTKFDKTKKVLAAIQVIEEENEDDNAFREPCQAESDITVDDYIASPADLVLAKEGDTFIVTGNVNATNVTGYEDLFGNMEDAEGTYVAIELKNVIPKKENVEIIQTNPALAYWITKDDNVKFENGQYVKTKNGYDGNTDPNYAVVAKAGDTKNITVAIDGRIYTIKNQIKTSGRSYTKRN